MPINNDLPDKKFPMKFKWDEKAQPDFRPSHQALTVRLLNAPTREDILSYLPEFSLATWEDKPRINQYSQEEREQCLVDLMQRKVLPNIMETIGFTFLISNIDLIDVTHLIRHRTFTFSAHCTGDRDQRDDTALLKPSILESTEFLGRYMDTVTRAYNLYAKMLDSKEISVLDARTILPRCLANHYYARASLKDIIPFFIQRLDKQIQPESDNLIAMHMLVEVARIIPEIKYQVDPEAVDKFFVITAQTDHSSNLYQPEEKNDVFEWKPQWFVYDKKRADMPGGHIFETMYNNLLEQYKLLTDHVA